MRSGLVTSLLCWAVLAAAAEAARGGEAAGQSATAATTQAEVVVPRTQRWFGVAVENIPGPIARQLKLHKDQGLMVVSVLAGSPAEKAGLRAEDLLIEANGQPLTSQEELSHAANLVEVTGKGEVQARVSTLVYLRDGDRAEAVITPEPRPATMLVVGPNRGNFVASVKNEAGGTPQMRVRNYVLPNGGAAQVGPGYRVDPSSNDAAGLSMLSIRSLVLNGQTVVLTQETDAAGRARYTITVGTTTYEVDKGKVGSLPADLRPLAEQLLKAPVNGAAGGALGGAAKERVGGVLVVPPATQASDEDRIKELEARIRALEQRNDKPVQEQGRGGGEKVKVETPGK